MRSIEFLTLLLFLLLTVAPFASADDVAIPKDASHFISVKGDAAAAAAATVKGDSLYYTYAVGQIPQVDCRGAVSVSFYLKDAAGNTHTPMTKSFGGDAGVRSDGATNGFLAHALGDRASVNVELRVRVECTDAGGAVADALVQTIGVVP